MVEASMGPVVVLAARAEGHYSISRTMHDSMVWAGFATPTSHSPHPALAIVATLATEEMPIEALLAACDSRIADGPMLAECRVELHRELRFDISYRVTREIISVERKRSRRFGAMDLLRFVANLYTPDGCKTTQITYTWILPRAHRTTEGIP